MAETKVAGFGQRLMALFASNTRSSGRYNARTDKAFTADEAISLDVIERHISGAEGCGGVPILDDDSAKWGAIDCDNHGSDEDLPIGVVDDRLRELGLPLIPCRSKSGGIHLYAFFAEPQPAAKVQALLREWAQKVGYGGSEIFPKQGRLPMGRDNRRMKGNWINFPYFDAAKTMRYAIVGKKKLTLEEFLNVADKLKITDKTVKDLAGGEHPDAPPCIQHIFKNGVAQGHRNEGLYNVVVYLRKIDSSTAEAKATDANQTIFDRPLARTELGRTVNSAMRSEMGYRCQQEPIRSLCNRDVCLKRKFGITPADLQRPESEPLPTFGALVKYLSEPVRWDVEINGVRITNVSTDDLLDWRAIRSLIAERLTKVVPIIKNQEWERILMPLMKEARIVETPDDASITGVIRARLREYASKTDLTNKGEDTADRVALLRGLPVVVSTAIDGLKDRYVCFRGEDFVNYLKRTKSEELKGINLWMAVKEMCQHTKMRAGDQSINIWAVRVKDITEHLLRPEPKEFQSEL